MALVEKPKYSPESYDIRPSKGHEETYQIWYPFMLKLRWDRGPADLATYLDHSRSRGMILAFPHGSSEPVGHVVAVVNDNSTGWVGLFIVDEAYQGVGLGAALWKDMMKDVQGIEHVGLDAVPQQKLTYERRGFVDSQLGQIKLMHRRLSSPSTWDQAGDRMIELSKVPSQLLAQYDLKYTGFSRPKMWDNLVNRPDVVGFVLSTGALQSVDDVRGYALLRRCPEGIRLGPVYAENAEAAEAVVSSTMSLATPEYIKQRPMEGTTLPEKQEEDINSEANVVVEIWGGNPEAQALFEKLGWTLSGYYHRMWLNNKATPAQSPGGAAQTGLFASCDAAVG